MSKGDLENRELNKTEDFLSGKSCPSLGRPELVFWLHTAIKDPVSKLPALFGWFLYLLHPGLSSSQEAEKKESKDKEDIFSFLQCVSRKFTHYFHLNLSSQTLDICLQSNY